MPQKNQWNFDIYFQQIMNEMSTASVGIGGTATDLASSSDFYAPGSARIPTILGAKKVKKKKKKKLSEKKRIPIIRRPRIAM
jgi:hypothetical protein